MRLPQWPGKTKQAKVYAKRSQARPDPKAGVGGGPTRGVQKSVLRCLGLFGELEYLQRPKDIDVTLVLPPVVGASVRGMCSHPVARRGKEAGRVAQRIRSGWNGGGGGPYGAGLDRTTSSNGRLRVLRDRTAP